MEHKVCCVCKTPIDSILVIESAQGPVHPGQCYNYVEETPMIESDDSFLTETELLC